MNNLPQYQSKQYVESISGDQMKTSQAISFQKLQL